MIRIIIILLIFTIGVVVGMASNDSPSTTRIVTVYNDAYALHIDGEIPPLMCRGEYCGIVQNVTKVQ